MGKEPLNLKLVVIERLANEHVFRGPLRERRSQPQSPGDPLRGPHTKLTHNPYVTDTVLPIVEAKRAQMRSTGGERRRGYRGRTGYWHSCVSDAGQAHTSSFWRVVPIAGLLKALRLERARA